MRRILRTLLHSFGAREVYEAEDGATGLEMFTHYLPDIVITDWAMPIFDGLELTQMIRQPGANSNPYVPIIMLTGHSEKRRVIAARDAGVTEFLAKPISAKGLYQRILNVVANPRPFIRTKTYFGPDRRRNTNTPISARSAATAARPRSCSSRLLDKARPPSSAATRRNQMAKEKPGRCRSRPSPTIKSSCRPTAAQEVRVDEHDLDDPVARAEAALAGLSDDFSGWMERKATGSRPRMRAILQRRLHDGQSRRTVPRRP